MAFEDIIKIGLWILASLGGAGGIILGFSNFFGRLFVKRCEEKVKAKFQMEIDKYHNQLEIIKETTLRYSSKQFYLYCKLWSSLYDLKLLGDDLWEKANPIRLEKFSKQLKTTKSEIEKASLFIEEVHYKELVKILAHFSEYKIGKGRLIDYRKEHEREYDYDNDFILQVIDQNREKMKIYEDLIGEIKHDLKRQLKGKICSNASA